MCTIGGTAVARRVRGAGSHRRRSAVRACPAVDTKSKCRGCRARRCSSRSASRSPPGCTRWTARPSTPTGASMSPTAAAAASRRRCRSFASPHRAGRASPSSAASSTPRRWRSGPIGCCTCRAGSTAPSTASSRMAATRFGSRTSASRAVWRSRPTASLLVGDRSGHIFHIDITAAASALASLPASVAAFHLAMGPDGWLYVTGPDACHLRPPVSRVDDGAGRDARSDRSDGRRGWPSTATASCMSSKRWPGRAAVYQIRRTGSDAGGRRPAPGRPGVRRRRRRDRGHDRRRPPCHGLVTARPVPVDGCDVPSAASRLELLDREAGQAVGRRHQRVDQVEERERGIGERRDAERLRHERAAGVPGHQRRRQRAGILEAARQVLGMEPRVARTRPGTSGRAARWRCTDPRRSTFMPNDVASVATIRLPRAAHEAEDARRDPLQHAGRFHHRAEHHRRQDQPHRRQHARHAAARQQFVERGIARCRACSRRRATSRRP